MQLTLDCKEDGYICVDMQRILWDIFEEILEKIAFDREQPLMVGGLTIAKAFEKFMHYIWFDCLQHPLNALTGGFLARHKLIEPSRKASLLIDQITKVLLKEYDHRMTTKKDSELGPNIFDLIVKHNRSATKDQQMQPHEIVQNVMNFQVAGIDTTFATT